FWILDPLGPLAFRIGHTPHLLPWLWRFAKAGTEPEVKRISQALASLNSRVYGDLIPLFEKVGLNSELVRKGALTVYESERSLERDRPVWNAKRAFGLESTELPAARVREMEPALGPIVIGGV